MKEKIENKVGKMQIGRRKMVEIEKEILRKKRVIIIDEKK